MRKLLAALVTCAALAVPASASAATTAQVNFSNWYVMTYRCGHVAAPWYYGGWNPFRCAEFNGSDDFGSHVATYFTEVTSWGFNPTCYVNTSWYGSFHELSSGCF